MKVLVVHNFYRSSAPSGEDAVVRAEVELLRRHGVEVVTYHRENDTIAGALGTLSAAIATVWSRRSYREVTRLLRSERPDVAHFHNIWYLVSAAAHRACRDAGVPVVQTLHNYRLFCANGLLMREGRVCEDCIGTLPWRGAARGCFRSRLATLPVVAANVIHGRDGGWARNIDTFVALSRFAREKFVECGLPGDRIVVKPNAYAGEPPEDVGDDGYGLFLGRLSHEKGASVLVEATRRSRVPVKLVGDGPLRGALDVLARGGAGAIELLGRRPHTQCMRLLARASFLVLPTLCYENFPMALVEAYACGKPVVASRLGACAELVEDGRTGLLFETGHAGDLAAKLAWLAANPRARAEMGRRARAVFESAYTGERSAAALLDLYRSAVSRARSGSVAPQARRLSA